MTKQSLINAIIAGLFICGLIGAIYWVDNYMKEHRCDNPYEKVCIKSHTVIIMMPFVTRVGKTSVTNMRPMPNKVCDEYETVLKKGCEDEIK